VSGIHPEWRAPTPNLGPRRQDCLGGTFIVRVSVPRLVDARALRAHL
jgi:hypothetical protein